MKRYHITNDGTPRVCQAVQGKCPFGRPEDHFDSKEKASAYYEILMATKTFPALNRSSSAKKVFETVHGSHLYGLARPSSDIDFYRVLIFDAAEAKAINSRQRSVKTKQVISGEDDVLEIGLSEFLNKCDEGVPQSLEAMYSRQAPESPFDDFRSRYRLNTARFASTYRRTVLNFARLGIEDDRAKELIAPSEEELSKKRAKESIRVKKPQRVERNGMIKYRRHAVRLLLNRDTGLEYGYFNPTLRSDEKDYLMKVSELTDTEYAKLMKARVY